MNEFTTTLLQWYAAHRRDLPWRDVGDPYAVWLSEIILQQTRIDQGRAYWERFMLHYPTVQALAAASEDEVMRLWQGLGYYSRARNLHAAAKQIVALGAFPSTLEAIAALPGVGPYTAAAIASFAFGLPVATVDGNAYRVLARHFGIDTPINTTEGKKLFATLAQEQLLPALNREGMGAGLYNQAIMDFGAIQCTPQSPKCDDCPLMESCEAFRTNRIQELPVKLKTLKIRERHLIFIYIRYKGQTAIHRRGAGDIWQGLYEPLSIDGGQLTVDNWAAQNHYPLSTANCQLLRKNVRHVLTHRILYADFYLWEPDKQPSLPSDYIWIPESDIDNYALPRLIEILLELLNSEV
jgi:A/G-specific adenine glycosylase